MWKIKQTTRQLRLVHGRKPTTEEIAVTSGLKVGVIGRLQDVGGNILSLDQMLSNHSPKSSPGPLLKDLLSDKQVVPVDLRLEAEERFRNLKLEAEEKLEEAIQATRHILDTLDSHLSERNRNIFKLFYGLDEDGEKRTLEVVGQMFDGLTKERVRQIIRDIWGKLGENGSEMTPDLFLEKLKWIGNLKEALSHLE
jgi:DNA-directed RNA polymerase sigma subunit (sigma70/sigma32)